MAVSNVLAAAAAATDEVGFHLGPYLQGPIIKLNEGSNLTNSKGQPATRYLPTGSQAGIQRAGCPCRATEHLAAQQQHLFMQASCQQLRHPPTCHRTGWRGRRSVQRQKSAITEQLQSWHCSMPGAAGGASRQPAEQLPPRGSARRRQSSPVVRRPHLAKIIAALGLFTDHASPINRRREVR